MPKELLLLSITNAMDATCGMLPRTDNTCTFSKSILTFATSESAPKSAPNLTLANFTGAKLLSQKTLYCLKKNFVLKLELNFWHRPCIPCPFIHTGNLSDVSGFGSPPVYNSNSSSWSSLFVCMF